MRLAVVPITAIGVDQDTMNRVVMDFMRDSGVKYVITPLTPGLGMASAYAATHLDLSLTTYCTYGQDYPWSDEDRKNYHGLSTCANDHYWIGQLPDDGGFTFREEFCQAVACMSYCDAILTCWDGNPDPRIPTLQWLTGNRPVKNIYEDIVSAYRWVTPVQGLVQV
ncbi:hypothetical protein Rctr71_063 [Virus Rctr71]|nr:hypothetical protein Rctr71_063 [Virus Rctr71]